MAVEALKNLDVEETRGQSALDRIEERLVEWNSADGVAGFRHCTLHRSGLPAPAFRAALGAGEREPGGRSPVVALFCCRAARNLTGDNARPTTCTMRSRFGGSSSLHRSAIDGPADTDVLSCIGTAPS